MASMKKSKLVDLPSVSKAALQPRKRAAEVPKVPKKSRRSDRENGARLIAHKGSLEPGYEIESHCMTPHDAQDWCFTLSDCVGFTFRGSGDETIPIKVWFVRKWNLLEDDDGWISYLRVSTSCLDEAMDAKRLRKSSVPVDMGTCSKAAPPKPPPPRALPRISKEASLASVSKSAMTARAVVSCAAVVPEVAAKSPAMVTADNLELLRAKLRDLQDVSSHTVVLKSMPKAAVMKSVPKPLTPTTDSDTVSSPVSPVRQPPAKQRDDSPSTISSTESSTTVKAPRAPKKLKRASKPKLSSVDKRCVQMAPNPTWQQQPTWHSQTTWYPHANFFTPPIMIPPAMPMPMVPTAPLDRSATCAAAPRSRRQSRDIPLDKRHYPRMRLNSSAPERLKSSRRKSRRRSSPKDISRSLDGAGGSGPDMRSDNRLQRLIGRWKDRRDSLYEVAWDQAPSSGPRPGVEGLTVITTRPSGRVQRTSGLIRLHERQDGGRPMVVWGFKSQYYLDEEATPGQAVWNHMRSSHQVASRQGSTPMRGATTFIWTRIT